MPPRIIRLGKRPQAGSYLLTKSDFPQTKEERKAGFWQIDGDSVYISCVGCGSALNISTHGIDRHTGVDLVKVGYNLEKHLNYGIVSPCVVCHRCGNHLFPFLEGYDSSRRSAVLDGNEERDDDYDGYDDDD
jgi:hypothetical protein